MPMSIETGPKLVPTVSQATERVCLITMARNEPLFLAHWIWHYSISLEQPKFILIDDASDPSMVRNLRLQFPDADLDVFRLPEGPFNDQYKSNALSSIAIIAVERYAVVITTDADEIVAPIGESRGQDLFDVLRSAPRPFTAPIGVAPVHDFENEPPFDAFRSVGSQRAFGQLRSASCKPCIWQGEPWLFSPGQHGLRQRRVLIYPRLALIHLKYIDADALRKRQRERISRELSDGQNSTFGLHWKQPPERQILTQPFSDLPSIRRASPLSEVIPTYLENSFDRWNGGYVVRNLKQVMPVSLKGEL